MPEAKEGGAGCFKILSRVVTVITAITGLFAIFLQLWDIDDRLGITAWLSGLLVSSPSGHTSSTGPWEWWEIWLLGMMLASGFSIVFSIFLEDTKHDIPLFDGLTPLSELIRLLATISIAVLVGFYFLVLR